MQIYSIYINIYKSKPHMSDKRPWQSRTTDQDFGFTVVGVLIIIMKLYYSQRYEVSIKLGKSESTNLGQIIFAITVKSYKPMQQ